MIVYVVLSRYGDYDVVVVDSKTMQRSVIATYLFRSAANAYANAVRKYYC